jgi:outer membrane protein assembly factor BamB
VFVAIRGSDGAILWQKAPPGVIATGPVVVAAGHVCFGYSLFNAPGGGIMALRASDGSPAWQTSLPNIPQVELAGGAGARYSLLPGAGASGLPSLTAYSASTGKALYQHPFPSLPVQFIPAFEQPPVVTGGTLYVVAPAEPATGPPSKTGPQPLTVLMALNASNGGLKWYRTFDAFIAQTPVVVAS